ncbi:uncharacterized protein BO95DRAFT_460684 [Aspergillus brunneoviolaceus CBS 621.78]|uniref:Uncharacterized protein n=1 Tax=Aspergillus brunneoviolaceus CBS 621.78 TaxID=1450534 RepID=A0ACD1GI92_9EURO|nr:hypothetical protein BO95DRAFT_460684 [Aspergillus brunneoviolaceus CBS 621.78]RAH48829.1 hypothetical protein BO95DRAFT_460684 [Aspergillus brunneoviolaceus CBS 621.78]
MQQGQLMQESFQFALAQQEQQWDQQQWEQALERSSRQQQQKEEQGERSRTCPWPLRISLRYRASSTVPAVYKRQPHKLVDVPVRGYNLEEMAVV